MTYNTSIEMTGLKEAIRSLNKIEPGLRKQFVAEASSIASPAIREVQRGYTKVPLSGMTRQWKDAKGRKLFPFSLARAISGVQLKVDSDRRAVSLIYIAQMNQAAAIFETAGRANENTLGKSLGSLEPNKTRILGPAVFRKRREIEGELKRASQAIIMRVQKEFR
jgi:hypothetical protein